MHSFSPNASSIAHIQSGLHTLGQQLTLFSGNELGARDPWFSHQESIPVITAVEGGVSGLRMSKTHRRGENPYVFRSVGDATSQNGRDHTLNVCFENLGASFGHLHEEGRHLTGALSSFLIDARGEAMMVDGGGYERNMIDRAGELCQQFNDLSGTVQGLRTKADRELDQAIRHINDQLGEYTRLNDQIRLALAQSQRPLALYDAQDKILMDLSQYMDIQRRPCAGFEVEGPTKLQGPQGLILVSEEMHHPLQFDVTRSITPEMVHNEGTLSGIVWRWGKVPHDVSSWFKTGSLSALLDLRDKTLPRYQEQLDSLASSFREEVNALHNKGTSVTPPSELVGTRPLPNGMGEEIHFEGHLRIAVLTKGTNVVQEVHDIDLSGPATVGGLINAINAEFNGGGRKIVASLNPNTGTLNLRTSDPATRGISLGHSSEHDQAIHQGTNQGFSHFFGLNDLFQSTERFKQNDPAQGPRRRGVANEIRVSEKIQENPRLFARAQLTTIPYDQIVQDPDGTQVPAPGDRDQDRAATLGFGSGDFTVGHQINAMRDERIHFDAAGGMQAMLTDPVRYIAEMYAGFANEGARIERAVESSQQHYRTSEAKLLAERSMDQEQMELQRAELAQVRENFTSVTTVDAQHLHMYGEQNAGFFEQCFAMANSHFNLQYMFGGMGTQRPPFSENLLADFKERYGFEAFEPYDGPGPYPDYDPADPQLNRVGTPFHVENYVQNSPDARVFSMGDHESYTVPLKARDLTKLFQSMIIFAEAVRKGEVTAEVIQECGVMIDHLIPQVQDAVGYAAVALQTSERVIEESLEKREAAIEAHDQLVGFNTLKHAQEKSAFLGASFPQPARSLDASYLLKRRPPIHGNGRLGKDSSEPGRRGTGGYGKFSQQGHGLTSQNKRPSSLALPPSPLPKVASSSGRSVEPGTSQRDGGFPPAVLRRHSSPDLQGISSVPGEREETISTDSVDNLALPPLPSGELTENSEQGDDFQWPAPPTRLSTVSTPGTRGGAILYESFPTAHQRIDQMPLGTAPGTSQTGAEEGEGGFPPPPPAEMFQQDKEQVHSQVTRETHKVPEEDQSLPPYPEDLVPVTDLPEANFPPPAFLEQTPLPPLPQVSDAPPPPPLPSSDTTQGAALVSTSSQIVPNDREKSGNLLAAIREGVQLRKVQKPEEGEEKKPNQDPRDSVLPEIRGGKTPQPFLRDSKKSKEGNEQGKALQDAPQGSPAVIQDGSIFEKLRQKVGTMVVPSSGSESDSSSDSGSGWTEDEEESPSPTSVPSGHATSFPVTSGGKVTTTPPGPSQLDSGKRGQEPDGSSEDLSGPNAKSQGEDVNAKDLRLVPGSASKDQETEGLSDLNSERLGVTGAQSPTVPEEQNRDQGETVVSPTIISSVSPPQTKSQVGEGTSCEGCVSGEGCRQSNPAQNPSRGKVAELSAMFGEVANKAQRQSVVSGLYRPSKRMESGSQSSTPVTKTSVRADGKGGKPAVPPQPPSEINQGPEKTLNLGGYIPSVQGDGEALPPLPENMGIEDEGEERFAPSAPPESELESSDEGETDGPLKGVGSLSSSPSDSKLTPPTPPQSGDGSSRFSGTGDYRGGIETGEGDDLSSDTGEGTPGAVGGGASSSVLSSGKTEGGPQHSSSGKCSGHKKYGLTCKTVKGFRNADEKLGSLGPSKKSPPLPKPPTKPEGTRGYHAPTSSSLGKIVDPDQRQKAEKKKHQEEEQRKEEREQRREKKESKKEKKECKGSSESVPQTGKGGSKKIFNVFRVDEIQYNNPALNQLMHSKAHQNPKTLKEGLQGALGSRQSQNAPTFGDKGYDADSEEEGDRTLGKNNKRDSGVGVERLRLSPSSITSEDRAADNPDDTGLPDSVVETFGNDFNRLEDFSLGKEYAMVSLVGRKSLSLSGGNASYLLKNRQGSPEKLDPSLEVREKTSERSYPSESRARDDLDGVGPGLSDSVVEGFGEAFDRLEAWACS
eukprot:g8558.t1